MKGLGVGHRRARCGQRRASWRRVAILTAIACVAVVALGSGAASAQVVRVGHHTFGVMRGPKWRHVSTSAALAVQPTQTPLVYNGGPVMLTSHLYLIFWGPSGSFASTFENPVIQWAKDLAAASALNTSEFSINEEYSNAANQGISGTVVYSGLANDRDGYPAAAGECLQDPTANACVLDSQLQNEIKHEISLHGWPIDSASAPTAQYIVVFPSNVDGCMGGTAPNNDCTWTGAYCGYHGQITPASGKVIIYTNAPDVGCDSGQAPTGVAGNKDTDGEVDTLIHEVAESATDPESDSFGNGTGWTDSSGYEIGDKCDGQSVSTGWTNFDTYGIALGGSLSAGTAYNQVLNGHTYYTQQLYSNDSTLTPASTAAAQCVQRVGPSPWFTAPTGSTGTALTFNGASSYDIAANLNSYVWSFGDGSRPQSGASTTHIFDAPGTYTAKLNVGDSEGAASRSIEATTVTITGTALVPSVSSFSPPSAPTNATVTINGSNLASAQSVLFNGLAGTIVSDGATQITARVPNGGSTGPISVKTAGGTGTSSTNFTVTFSITGFTPSSGGAGTVVTIDGAGFNASSTVKFNGLAASSVVPVSATELQATVPSGATSGRISVTNTTAPLGTVYSRANYTP